MNEAGQEDGRLFPARPLIGVSIAVIRGGRVLLAARANEPMRGVWTLPGGLVEAGETLAAGRCASCRRRSACAPRWSARA